MKHFTYIALLLVSLLGNAQEYKNYDWEKAETYTPKENEKELGQIILLDKTISEFVVEKEGAYDYYIRHTKTFVNSDDAIEKNNRVYIPLRSENEEVVRQKVRVIQPSGKVVEVTDADVMESVDERTRTKLTYFALKGLEKKSVIEQILVAKLVPKVNGNTIVVQDEIPTKNVYYEIIYPNNLVFAFKSYNGLPEFVRNDSIYKDKIQEKIEIPEIPALNDEEYANYIANVKKFSYKLTANTYTGKKDLYGYKQYTADLFSMLDEKPDSKTEKSLDRFISGIPSGKTNEEKIRNIENYVKKNIQYNEHAESISIQDALNVKYANSMGFMLLYENIFRKMNIPHQLVVVSNRYKNPMDPKFENYKNLDEFVFYFPETKGYIAPSEVDSRYPVLPYRWTNSYALFLKKVDFGGASIPDYDIKKIETPGVDFTHDKMNINVDMSQNIVQPHVSTKIIFNGYSAASLQPYYDFIPEENIKDFEQELAENYCGQKDGVTVTVENKGVENLSKPYIFKAEFDAANLTQKAGNKILFKVGQTIGKQVELYQKDKRQMPVEIPFPHAYERTITLKLPDGYSVKNPEQINSSYVVMNNGKESAKFSTTHEISDSTLVIKNVEYYKDVELPLSVYDDYIKVINAAADFNKLVLVLEKNE